VGFLTDKKKAKTHLFREFFFFKVHVWFWLISLPYFSPEDPISNMFLVEKIMGTSEPETMTNVRITEWN